MTLRPAVAAVALLLAACSGGTEPKADETTTTTTTAKPTTTSTTKAPKGETRPGYADVYRRIETETDCTKLQAEFDQAWENHKRDKARKRLDLMEIDTSYMDAAADRMEDIGCYR